MKYDIIGDIHGQAEKLENILLLLGYRKKNRIFSQHGHTAVFLGDFIDRGPEQRKTVQIVRRMVESKAAVAVMGNHEYNAIAWFTPNPLCPGSFMRTRDGNSGLDNRRHHSAFLAEFESSPKIHAETITWFSSLPLWLELPGFRAVHACWHGAYIGELQQYLSPSKILSHEDLFESFRPTSRIHLLANAVLKGVEISLPEGLKYVDETGKHRNHVRTAWWMQSTRSLKHMALVSEKVKKIIPNETVTDKEICPYDNLKPVFFGHYWMTGTPRLQSSRIACLDYSGEPNKPIVAYRWDGENDLNAENFIQLR